MSISNEDYSYMTKRASPKSPVLLDSVKAFVIGGLICAFAELLNQWFLIYGMKKDDSRALAMILVIVITAILTALEFKAEGKITGTAAQMFSIAGPVVVFGCSAATIYGVIIYIFHLY